MTSYWQTSRWRCLACCTCVSPAAGETQTSCVSFTSQLPALEALGLEGLAELDDQLLADITLALPGPLHLRISRCR